MKGIVLAGGLGKRCEPLTSQYFNKHLIELNGKKMIQYPIETLKQLGITEILLITSPQACGKFIEFFEDGSEFGINLTYKIQVEPDGIMGGLRLAENFVGSDENFAVILGDNYFDFSLSKLQKKNILSKNFVLFIKHLNQDARNFGVLTEFGIVEKMDVDEGNIVTGMYIYPNNVFKCLNKFVKSKRGEYEITDVNNYLLSKMGKNKEDALILLSDDEKWWDMGSLKEISKMTNEYNYLNKNEVESFQSTPNFPPEIAEVFKDIVVNLRN